MEEKNYKELTHRMYCFFKDFTGDGLPSFSKFARSEKMTLERLKSYRENPEFDRIFRECKEIRRDMEQRLLKAEERIYGRVVIL